MHGPTCIFWADLTPLPPKIRDDQLRNDGNHPDDTGFVADVVPFDGIGASPGLSFPRRDRA